MRVVVPAAVVGWIGLTLLLAELRWFARPHLAERLAPYVPGGGLLRSRGGLLSVGSFREAIGPFAQAVGARCSRAFGVTEELGRRLERVHADLDVTGFRIRQLGWSLAALGVAGLLSVAVRPPPVVVVLLMVGSAVLAFLVVEQRITLASDRRKRRVELELPVVAEQIGMLLAAGYSLGGALARVARRGRGAVAQDLATVLARIRHGTSEEQALREWADLADVDAVGRLVAVLSLNRDAGDLGRLIGAEARGIRRDVQRALVETLERRGQQVWIPVTVATLLPGAIFIGVPFVDALSGFML